MVKLTYAAPAAEVEAVYVIVGASPIAVFREEDYARTLNMDNNPTPQKTRRSAAVRRRAHRPSAGGPELGVVSPSSILCSQWIIRSKSS